MAAAINWYAYNGTNLTSLASSGCAFFGDGGFGDSIQVGEYNGHTFQSNSNGTVEGIELWNHKYVDPTSVVLGQTGTPILLNQIPNSQALINMRFTNDTAVRVTNASIMAYDRNSSGNMPSGITTTLYEVVHTGLTQTADGSGGPNQPTTSGHHRWWVWDGVNITGAMPLVDSPGTSGLSPSGSSTVDTQHDFYISCSVSPNSIGSKLFGLFAQLEYL